MIGASRPTLCALLQHGSIFSIFSSDELVVVYNQMIALAANKLSTWTSDKHILTFDRQFVRCTAVMTMLNTNSGVQHGDGSEHNAAVSTAQSARTTSDDNTVLKNESNTATPQKSHTPAQQVLLILYPIVHNSNLYQTQIMQPHTNTIPTALPVLMNHTHMPYATYMHLQSAVPFPQHTYATQSPSHALPIQTRYAHSPADHTDIKQIG